MTRRLFVICFLVISSAFGSEIREFDLKTLQQLGNELTRVSQTRDRGATDPARKKAIQTAKAALQGKLFNIHYDYVVLNDPKGSGFLVYALGSTGNAGDVVLAGHFRVMAAKRSVSTRFQRASRYSTEVKVCHPALTWRVSTWCRLSAPNR